MPHSHTPRESPKRSINITTIVQQHCYPTTISITAVALKSYSKHLTLILKQSKTSIIYKQNELLPH